MKKKNTTAERIRALRDLVFMCCFITSIYAPAQAYDRKEYDRLLITNVCRDCDLYRARLSKTDLSNADLTGSNLISANLQKATLYKAKIDGVNFSNANLEGAMWVDGDICQEGSIGHCVKKEE